MLRSYKYRIFPTDEQKLILSKAMGAIRFVYNKALNERNKYYEENQKGLSFNYLASSFLRNLKNENEWLKESYAQSLQMSVRNLKAAYKNFFEGNADFPTFKSKKSKQSVQFPQGVKIDFKSFMVHIPKCGPILAVFHRKFDGVVKTCTVIKTRTNKYYVSVLVKTDDVSPTKFPINEDTTLGLDFGIKHFVVMSDGTKIDNPKHLTKTLEKLAVLQRRLSRKKKGSSNYDKAAFKVAKLQEKTTNQRHDFLHKLSYRLVRDNQTIIAEGIAVDDMLDKTKNSLGRTMRRNIQDSGWGTFRLYLGYKSEWYGRNYIKTDRYEPTSKTCSCCGHINHDLKLSDRIWTCPNCGTKHDRDVNAAINIKKLGLAKTSGLVQSLEPVENFAEAKFVETGSIHQV